MPIVSSIIVEDHVQQDGRRSIAERHTDQTGGVQFARYLAEVAADADATMAARVSDLNAGLITNEIGRNIVQVITLGSLAVPTFVHSTVAQNAATLRAFYQVSTQLQAVMIGDFLNTLTNAQIATAFSITTQQAATLRTNKLAPAAALAADIRAAAGQ